MKTAPIISIYIPICRISIYQNEDTYSVLSQIKFVFCVKQSTHSSYLSH